MTFPVVPEIHEQGHCSLENLEVILELDKKGELMDCDVGIQVHDDGRIWICINGIAFLRFKKGVVHGNKKKEDRGI